MLPEAMSIFARSTRAPSGNSPSRMRANRSRLSATGRPPARRPRQPPRAVRGRALAPAREQVEALRDRALAPRAVPARLGQGAAVLADLVGPAGGDVGPAPPGPGGRAAAAR